MDDVFSQQDKSLFLVARAEEVVKSLNPISPFEKTEKKGEEERTSNQARTWTGDRDEVSGARLPIPSRDVGEGRAFLSMLGDGTGFTDASHFYVVVAESSTPVPLEAGSLFFK